MKSVVVRSRLTGKLGAAPVRAVPDLFEVQEESPTSPVRAVSGGVPADLGITFLGRPPEPLETKAVEQVVAPLSGSMPWTRWIASIPIVQHVHERVGLQALDREALGKLSHLQHVCHRPRLHLRVEDERVRVSRARRVPARAVASLVSHPDDWEHRTIRAIQPARVLATQVEDEWNLYENRLAVRLVDHLLVWTGRRVDELRRLAKLAEEARSFDDETRGSRFRGRRLYELWGEVVVDDALGQELSRTLSILERLQRDLQALLDSPLYREVPRSTFVPAALVPTNILVNDPHYRKVAALWRAWARHGHVPSATREALRARRQTDCRNFTTFALLVVARALADLGYMTPTDDAPDCEGGLVLDGPLGEVRLTAAGGTISLAINDRILRIVPCLVAVDRESAAAMWEQIRGESDRPEDTVVLWLGRPEDLEHLEPGAARALGGWEHPRVLPISPWTLDCVERVARVVRQWEATHRFSGYPPRAKVQPDPGIALPPWLHRAVGSAWVAVGKPAPLQERQSFARACQKRKADLQRAEATARNTQRQFDPGLLGAIDALLGLAERAGLLEPWATCPVCDSLGAKDFEARPASREEWERWSWWCCCSRCSSSWGTQPCAACKRAVPVLLPHGRRSHPGDIAPPVGWLDRTYGRDVWAEPPWNSEDAGGYRCAACEARPGGEVGRQDRPQDPRDVRTSAGKRHERDP
jgi:hypothetical protein